MTDMFTDTPVGSIWRDGEGSIYVVDEHRKPSHGEKRTLHVTCTYKAPHIVRHVMDMWITPDHLTTNAVRVQTRTRTRTRNTAHRVRTGETA